MWTISEPVVREWIERNLGPVGKIEDVGRGVGILANMVTRLPQIAIHAERLLLQLERDTEKGISLSPSSIERAGEAAATRGRMIAVALWVIAIALVVGLF
jgi:ubiquinone biosynthesis protein